MVGGHVAETICEGFAGSVILMQLHIIDQYRVNDEILIREDEKCLTRADFNLEIPGLFLPPSFPATGQRDGAAVSGNGSDSAIFRLVRDAEALGHRIEFGDNGIRHIKPKRTAGMEIAVFKGFEHP